MKNTALVKTTSVATFAVRAGAALLGAALVVVGVAAIAVGGKLELHFTWNPAPARAALLVLWTFAVAAMVEETRGVKQSVGQTRTRLQDESRRASDRPARSGSPTNCPRTRRIVAALRG